MHRWALPACLSAPTEEEQRHPEEPPMPIPKHVFDPPFNIVRSSHIALGVADLGRARAFYEGALGLIVEDLDKAARFFKGKGLRHAFVERPYQGRTLQAVDPFGMPMEFYFAMEKRERL